MLGVLSYIFTKNKIQASPNDHLVLNQQKLHAFTCLQYRMKILEPPQFYALKWARCLPMWGKVLSQQGQGACPCWAEFMPDGCPIS